MTQFATHNLMGSPSWHCRARSTRLKHKALVCLASSIFVLCDARRRGERKIRYHFFISASHQPLHRASCCSCCLSCCSCLTRHTPTTNPNACKCFRRCSGFQSLSLARLTVKDHAMYRCMPGSFTTPFSSAGTWHSWMPCSLTVRVVRWYQASILAGAVVWGGLVHGHWTVLSKFVHIVKLSCPSVHILSMVLYVQCNSPLEQGCSLN